MSLNELVIGIDLGTTNSEVAAFLGDKVQVLGPTDSRMLPSCVGLAPDGELLVGKAARNQQLLYPERTARSIKRKMGSDASVKLGDLLFTPPEISAFILRALAEQASRELGETVKKAVITVPAYFSNAQRQATREAGALADLDVIRILNEPHGRKSRLWLPKHGSTHGIGLRLGRRDIRRLHRSDRGRRDGSAGKPR